MARADPLAPDGSRLPTNGTLRRGSAVALALALLAGCVPSADRDYPAEARTGREAAGLVDAYFQAVASSEGDRGWSLLHPETRKEVFGDDFEAYTRLAAAEDWSDFHWTVLDVVADDPSLDMVKIHVEGGRQSTPRFLYDFNGTSLVPLPTEQQAREIDQDPGETNVYVRVNQPFGPRGIVAVT